MTNTTNTTTERKPLRRRSDEAMFGGVAAGIAEHFDLDVTAVRIGAVALTLMGGAGIPLYAAAWLLIPDAGTDHSVGESFLDSLGLR